MFCDGWHKSGGPRPFLPSAGTSGILRQFAADGDQRSLSDEELLLRLVLEGEEFRHGRDHGCEAEVDLATRVRTDHLANAAGIVSQHSDRQFRATAEQGRQSRAFVVAPEPARRSQEGAHEKVIENGLRLWRDDSQQWFGHYFGDTVDRWHRVLNLLWLGLWHQRRVNIPAIA